MSSRRHLKSAGSLPGIVWQDTFRRDGALWTSYPEIGAGQWVYESGDFVVTTLQISARDLAGNPLLVDGVVQYNQVMPAPDTNTAFYQIRPLIDFAKPWEAEFDVFGIVSPSSGIYGSLCAWWVYFQDADNALRLQSHPATQGSGYRRLIIQSWVGGVEDRSDYEFAVPNYPGEPIFIPVRAVYNGSTIAVYVNEVLAYTIVNPSPAGSTQSRLTIGGITGAGDAYRFVGASRLTLKQ